MNKPSFWSTENGRIIGNVIHETNSDIGLYKNDLHLLQKYREKVTFEQTPENLKFFEYFDSLVEKRSNLGERTKKAVDKAYNHFKELYQKE